jgi:carboxylate-amine ligase
VADEQDLDIALELTRAMVEINSPVCDTAGELRGCLTEMRGKLAQAAAEEGAHLLAIAVPPHGKAAQPITNKPRYRELASQWGLLAREQSVCGCHVHVDVHDKETAVRVSNHLRPWLPTLLALTANSPIYLDQDTGFSSWRWLMTTRWPCAGLRVLGALRRTGGCAPGGRDAHRRADGLLGHPALLAPADGGGAGE